MNIDMSPMAKAFVVGVFLGALYGVLYCVFEVYGSVDA